MNDNASEKLILVRQEPSLLQIGKRGVTDAHLNELEELFKQHEFIKVKILKNSPYPTRAKAFEILQNSLSPDYSIVEVRGWTAIIAKKKIKMF